MYPHLHVQAGNSYTINFAASEKNLQGLGHIQPCIWIAKLSNSPPSRDLDVGGKLENDLIITLPIRFTAGILIQNIGKPGDKSRRLMFEKLPGLNIFRCCFS